MTARTPRARTRIPNQSLARLYDLARASVALGAATADEYLRATGLARTFDREGDVAVGEAVTVTTLTPLGAAVVNAMGGESGDAARAWVMDALGV